MDEQIATILVQGVLSVIKELSDPKSTLRKDFEVSAAQMITQLHEDGMISKVIENFGESEVSNRKFADLIDRVIESTLRGIEDGMTTESDALAEMTARALTQFTDYALNDPSAFDALDALDARLLSFLNSAPASGRPFAMRYITETIAGWNSRDLVERIEQEVGHDLQYIRINGAVLDALIGGEIFVIGYVLNGSPHH